MPLPSNIEPSLSANSLLFDPHPPSSSMAFASSSSHSNNKSNNTQDPSSNRAGLSAGRQLWVSKIRNYLSKPVSWQPSADQRRLIGYMILTRFSAPTTATTTVNSDFGLKVVGGRHSSTNRLGAFITRVRPGSVADTVGQLRPGDEVLEWNGKCLQNISHEEVCAIINASKNDDKLELIFSRSALHPGYDDFLNLQRPYSSFAPPYAGVPTEEWLGYEADAYGRPLPHSQSLINAPFRRFTNAAAYFDHPQQQRMASPVVFHRPYASAGGMDQQQQHQLTPAPAPIPTNVHICGRIELSLLYIAQKRELIVTLHRAYDLAPRQDGSPRNPYVKIFLLPDRGEKSRRQSAVLAETLEPTWNEWFYYYELAEPILMTRVLEVTVWDYDRYESNCFLGETLIDLSQTLLDNRPFAYTLLDMDDENPIRLRLRHRRHLMNVNTPPTRSRSQMSHPRGYPSSSSTSEHRHHNYSLQDLPYDSETGYDQQHQQQRRSRYDGGDGPSNFSAADFAVGGNNIGDWTKNSEGGGGAGPGGGGGYLSDTNDQPSSSGGQRRRSVARRRPRSATALRNVVEAEEMGSDPRYGYQRNRHGHSHAHSKYNYQHHQPEYEQPPPHHHHMPSIGRQATDSGSDVAGAAPMNSSNNKPPTFTKSTRPTRHQELIMQEQQQGGYGSDGSIETMSMNSAQSMQNRAIQRAQQQQQQRQRGGGPHLPQPQSQIDEDAEGSGGSLRRNHAHTTSTETDYGIEDMGSQLPSTVGAGQSYMGGGGGKISVTGAPPQLDRNNMLMMKDRKKSLMTRLIPGRTGPSEPGKRMGFARSEEVGVSEALTVPGAGIQGNGGSDHPSFTKQTSKESNDSSDNLSWLPIYPDNNTLGYFVSELGPGQVVGRQALASPSMGELEVGLSLDPRLGIVVSVLQAKNLITKPNSRSLPMPYVKCYLLEGKTIVAKAKTHAGEKTNAPIFNQKLVFAHSPKGKMLQMTVLGDYSRMERRSFLGIMQISLDELELSQQEVVAWYRLFHSSSLAGSSSAGGGPIRKDSQLSVGGGGGGGEAN